MRTVSADYRPDIDGLRAVAVLSVMAFHFSPTLLSGGFVGVDIFFVISGLLITGIIDREISAGSFSFRHFYLRRIKRIMPAALLVIAVATVVAFAFLLPDDIEDVSRSSAYGLFSMANIYFWKYLDISYFAGPADKIPLLHLWSLGVEEQFYLVWPPLLVLAYRFSLVRWIVPALLVISAASFWVAQATLLENPKFAYYMLPARAGELGIGALLYYVLAAQRGAGLPRWLLEVCALAGVGLMAYAMLFLKDTSGFPGFNALYPCAGAALVLFSSSYQPTLVKRCLSLQPVVYIGLLSYSLYLWHWPVLAFYRYGYGEVGLQAGIALALLVAVVSYASYRWVESPLRHFKASPKVIFQTLFVKPTAILFLLAFIGIKSDGFDDLFARWPRYATTEQAIEEITRTAYKIPYNCQLRPTGKLEESIVTDSKCVLGAGEQPPRMLVMGDSNAAHYIGYLGAVAEKAGFRFRNLTRSACAPFMTGSEKYVREDRQPACKGYNERIFRETDNYDVIFIGGSWNAYASQSKDFARDLEQTLRYLSDRGKTVIVAGKAPLFPGFDDMCLVKAIRIPFLDCRTTSLYPDNGDIPVNSLIRKVVAAVPNSHYFSLRNEICREGICSPFVGDTPVYHDEEHLAINGSRLLSYDHAETLNLIRYLAGAGQ